MTRHGSKSLSLYILKSFSKFGLSKSNLISKTSFKTHSDTAESTKREILGSLFLFFLNVFLMSMNLNSA